MSDPLLRYRDEFPGLDKNVYMVSHSLGAMPRRAAEHLRAYSDLWVERGINAWQEWVPEIERAGDRIGRVLGAPPGSVMMATNVSEVEARVASCLDYSGPRRKVVYLDLEFPSVSYVWQAEAKRGAEVVVVPSDDGVHPPMERLLAAIDERTLIVPISHVCFRSSALVDVKAVVAKAHSVGALVLLDCYQSTGTIPFDVTELGVDFATGGSVKWLLGGPGAGYVYVRPGLLSCLEPRWTGWWGHKHPFAFTMPAQDYADTTWRMMAGTPAIAALYQARAGIELIAEIGVERIRAKSQRQTRRMMDQALEAGYTLRNPLDDQWRGGTVCIDFPGSGEVSQALNATGYLNDHRPGAGIRVSPHLYSTDEECDRMMAELIRLERALPR